MPTTKAHIRATTKYEKRAYDKTLLRMKAGYLDVIRSAAESCGESLNGFIMAAIRQRVDSINKEPTTR